MKPIRVTFNAALNNPNDSREVTLVAKAVGVGRTHRLATGQIITWTAEFLREKASSFIGMPVNIDLDEEDEPTGHSRRAVGAIKNAYFDEGEQGIIVTAALWRHYAPHTVERIKELANDPDARDRVQVSMEFIPEGELVANGDGSESPVDGEFSGLGIVRVGADPRNKVILVAALAEDEAKEPMPSLEEILNGLRDRFVLTEKTTPEQERDARNAELTAAHEGSLEWYSRRLAEHFSAKRGDDYEAPYCYVVATYPKYAIYQEGESYFQIAYARKGRDITFEEPVEVDPTYNPVEASVSEDTDAPDTHEEDAALATEITEELRASLREELLAEVQPQLDALTSERDAARQEIADRDAAAAVGELTTSRLAELETILPATDEETTTQRTTLVTALDDVGFAALKATLAAAADTKGGLATDADRHAGTEEEEGVLTEEQVGTLAGRALAAAGMAAPAKDK